MLSAYIEAAMRRAEFSSLEDGSVFVEIPGLQGVWANGPNEADARRELQEVLEDWIMLNLEDHVPMPDIGGISLRHASVG